MYEVGNKKVVGPTIDVQSTGSGAILEPITNQVENTSILNSIYANLE